MKNTPDAVATATRSVLRLKEPPRLWVNWRRGGSRPKFKHTSLEAVLAERTRLEQLHPADRIDTFELVPVRRGSR